MRVLLNLPTPLACFCSIQHIRRRFGPVEEGLRELEKLCVMVLVHTQSDKVIARIVPAPSLRQNELLDALKLSLPVAVPESEVSVVTRKKINKTRKPIEK